MGQSVSVTKHLQLQIQPQTIQMNVCLCPHEALLMDTGHLHSVSFPPVMKEYTSFLSSPPPSHKKVSKTTLGSLVLQKQESSRIWPAGPRWLVSCSANVAFRSISSWGRGHRRGPCQPPGQLEGMCGQLALPLGFGIAEVSRDLFVLEGERPPQPQPQHAQTGVLSEDVLADPPFPGSGGGLRFPGR